jgi:hypothetical protein
MRLFAICLGAARLLAWIGSLRRLGIVSTKAEGMRVGMYFASMRSFMFTQPGGFGECLVAMATSVFLVGHVQSSRGKCRKREANEI